MKLKSVLYSILIVLLGTLTFQSCNKNPITPPDVNPMDQLTIPDGFEFKTTTVKDIEIQMPSTIDFSTEKSRFNIYTANPADGGKLLTAGSFDSNGKFSGEIRVPTAQDSVFVQTVAGDQMVAVNPTLTTKSDVVVNFGGDYGLTRPDTATAADTVTSKASVVSFSNWTGKYQTIVPENNIIGNGDFETNDFGVIANWDVPHPVDGKWYFTNYANKKMEWYTDGDNHVVRTPYSDGWYSGGVSQWVNASPGDLITFSADVKTSGNKNNLTAWLYIIPVDANNNPIAYYYVENNKPATIWHTLTVAATMPAGTVKVNILIWTWDLGTNSALNFDNVVVNGPILDSDGDGVNNDLDDYPDDPTRAFNVYYPNENDWGTLAFEDLWPGMGDYDFNDLVLDYHFKSVLNASNKLVEFYTDYSVRAVGASLENGFGFMLGGDPANVASVTGTHYTENYIHNNANGTEQGQTNTVVILFDNAFSMIGNSGSSFINTKEDVPYVDPDTNTLHVVYQNPVSVTETGTAPYNPFLIINKERGKEVHLAGQVPTDLVNTSYFGTQSDDTDPAAGKYYQTVNNLPWAIDIPVSFAYPLEQVAILNAYNYFATWAESAGEIYPDWYMNETGYRNNSNIYAPPAK
ncbi:MAG: LruC domain-containing protein [Bacteroidales bacterium]|nr:LruC domain-containing protein [Bacteroidales bacterium]